MHLKSTWHLQASLFKYLLLCQMQLFLLHSVTLVNIFTIALYCTYKTFNNLTINDNVLRIQHDILENSPKKIRVLIG